MRWPVTANTVIACPTKSEARIQLKLVTSFITHWIGRARNRNWANDRNVFWSGNSEKYIETSGDGMKENKIQVKIDARQTRASAHAQHNSWPKLNTWFHLHFSWLCHRFFSKSFTTRQSNNRKSRCHRQLKLKSRSGRQFLKLEKLYNDKTQEQKPQN